MPKIDDSTLVAFVDGELDAASMRSMGEAVAQDPEAKEKVRLLRLSTLFVRAVYCDPAYQQVTPSLAERLEAPIGAPAAPPLRRRIAVLLAASLAFAAIGGGGFMLGSIHSQEKYDFGERLLDEVADYHVIFAREDEHRVEVAAKHLNHIEAWLGERLHRKLRVPDLTDHGLVFEGARLLVVDGQPVAQLIYDWTEHAAGPSKEEREPLGLCISFGAPGEQAIGTDSRNGVNLAIWRRKGYTYVLVGDVDKAVLMTLAVELMPRLDNS